MENNIYQPPESKLTASRPKQRPLASRWLRLGASLFDIIVMLGVIIALQMVWDAVAVGQVDVMYGSIVEQLVSGLISVLVFAAINAALLLNYGQTIGKKLVGIRIVNADNKQLPTSKQLIKRYSIYFGLSLIPMFGRILSLINICLIFGSTKQCFHDRVARTVVTYK